MLLREIEVAMPWDEIWNYIRVTAIPRKVESSTEIYRLNDVPLIIAGATLTIWAQHQYDGEPTPASAVTTPAATTDYTGNTAANGSGTNKTANLTVTATSYAAETLLTIENTDTVDIYLTLMKLRGTPLTALSETLAVDSDTTSIAAYSKRGVNVGSRWIQTMDHAVGMAGYMELFLPEIKRVPQVRLVDRFTEQFLPELGDKITLTVSTLGISGTYTLIQINHDWRAGEAFETTFKLVPELESFTGIERFPATFPMTLGW
jgi:hypothetical protein